MCTSVRDSYLDIQETPEHTFLYKPQKLVLIETYEKEVSFKVHLDFHLKEKLSLIALLREPLRLLHLMKFTSTEI